jgi:hypothetical protein
MRPLPNSISLDTQRITIVLARFSSSLNVYFETAIL